MASSLTERIESLDEETRECWGRVDELEDEEASLNRRLTELEKVRRGERLEILRIEQRCKTAEVAMLQAQEEAAELDAKAYVLENEAHDAAEAASAAADNATSAAPSSRQDSLLECGGVVSGHDESPASGLHGSAALLAALGQLPAHEKRREQLVSLLEQTEREARGEIAEAARSTAALRRSAKKRHAERVALEHETSTLRKQLAEMHDEEEIQSRMARARQTGEGLKRRLQEANDKLSSVQDTLAQGPANHMEEEEQQSLELMQGIAEAKACLRSREDMPEVADLSGRSVNRGGVGVSPTPTSSKHPRLDLRPARGSAGKRNRLESSRNHSTWGGGW